MMSTLLHSPTLWPKISSRTVQAPNGPLLRLFCVAMAIVILNLGSACSLQDPIEEVQTQQAKGHFAATITPLRELIEKDPDQAELQYLLGLALLRTGAAGSAVWPLRKASQNADYAVKAGLLLTEATLQSRFKDEAIQAAGNVLAIDPENILALEMRAHALQQGSRFEESLDDIERVLELDPENKRVLVARVVGHLGLAQEEEALVALEAARNSLLEPEETAENQRQDSGLDAARGKLCVVTAMFTFERGQGEEADQLFEQCVKDYPTDTLVIEESTKYYDRRGRPEQAQEILNSAFEAAPSSQFRTMLAARMQRTGDHQQTERLLKEEAEETKTSQAWFVLADHYVRNDRLEEAAEAFREGVATAPSAENSPMIHFAYADTLVQIGEFTKAREVAKAFEGSAMENLIEARLLAAEGKLEESLAAYESGIQLWPNNAGARLLAGQVAEKLGRFDAAESHYREAIRADKSSEASLYLSRLHEAQGEPTKALDRIGLYLRGNPTEPESYVTSIRLAQRLGQHEILKQGIVRLGKLPGQQGLALSVSARLASEAKGPKEAIRLLQESPLDLTDPINEAALQVLVLNLARVSDFKTAQEPILAAIQAHPEEATFHALLGRLKQIKNQPVSEAKQAYLRALELNAEDPVALAGLASIEAEANHLDRAIELYDQSSSVGDSERAAAAIAALSLIRQREPLEEQEAWARKFLMRHVHSPILASELAQIVAARQQDLSLGLALAHRAALFDQMGGQAALSAFKAVAASGTGPEASEAKSIVERFQKPEEK